MKIYQIALFLIFLSAGLLRADEIYLKDSTVIKGRIIQVTNTRVEYDPEGDIPFLTIENDKVLKIVYDNGSAVQMTVEKAADEIPYDTITLNDSTVIKCKVIQITNSVVEYDPEGKIPFLTVPASKVAKIDCADGCVAQIDSTPPTDRILLKNGDSIDCYVIKITATSVEFTSKKTGAKETADRADISNVIIRNTRSPETAQVDTATEEQTSQEEEQQSEPAPEVFAEHSGGFNDSIIWIAFMIGFNDTRGDIDKNEKYAMRSNKQEAIAAYDDFETDGGYYGLDMDLMLPSIKLIQRRGFDLTGFKFGLKTMYLKYDIYENITFHDDEKKSDNLYGGRLLEYRSANAGPEINFVISPRHDMFDMVFQLYATGGYIHKGKLSAMPALREAGCTIEKSDYQRSFSGYNMNFGFGMHFIFNKVVPFTVGLNFQSQYSKINFDRELPVYNNSKSMDFRDGGFNLTTGIHF